MPLLLTIGFIAAFIWFGYVIAKGLAEWHSNNKSPEISERMMIMEKKEVSDDDGTVYYLHCMNGAEEQFRFRVSGKVFRNVAEDEYIAVTHKGTRFLDYKKDTLMLDD